MRIATAALVALALSACVDFDPTTGPLEHGPGTCGGTSAYPTYPLADAGTDAAACPEASTKDSGYYY